VNGTPQGTAAQAHSLLLRDRYLAYCSDQGRELLNIIPREGVRSLLRHFRLNGGVSPFVNKVEDPEDRGTLYWLAERAMEILPLPPFEVWVQDFHLSRFEYATVPGPPMAPEAPDGEPVTVELRNIQRDAEEWVAALAVRPRAQDWVGHIRFHSPGVSQVFTTGEIFQESNPTDVRQRFRDFDDRTLGAFLSSTLP
jgi:hypothetical protein